MASTTLSLEQFQHDVAAAHKASLEGPVFITQEGEPTAVLTSVADYRQAHPAVPEPQESNPKPCISVDGRRSANPETFADLFDHPAFDNLPDDFDFPSLHVKFRPADFS